METDIDHKLLKDASEGNFEAFDELVRRHERSLYVIAKRITKNHPLALQLWDTGDSAARLLALLVHRGKDVQLWRKGGINFIANYEPKSPAAYFAAEHGPSASRSSWAALHG